MCCKVPKIVLFAPHFVVGCEGGCWARIGRSKQEETDCVVGNATNLQSCTKVVETKTKTKLQVPD